MRLKELQALVYVSITAVDDGGGSRRSRSSVLRLIRGDMALTAVQRLQIYIDAYFLRLLGCLKEDFPATLAVAGETQFDALVRSYLTKHPPTAPSIDYAGRHLAEFLGDHPLLASFPFLAELAQLERAIAEVFVAPDRHALSADDMRNLAPQDWPNLVLRTHPACQMLECNWRVADIRRAIENAAPWSDPAPEPSALVVWRQSTQVYFRELGPAEDAALRLGSEGATFATICQAVAEILRDQEPAEAIGRFLARWLADGLLVGSAASELSTK